MQVSEVKEELLQELDIFKNQIEQLTDEEITDSEKLAMLIEKIGMIHEKLIGLKFILSYEDDHVAQENIEQEVVEDQPEEEKEELAESSELEESEERQTELVPEEINEADDDVIEMNLSEDPPYQEDAYENDNEEEVQQDVGELLNEVENDGEEIKVEVNEVFSSDSDPSISGQLGKKPIVDLLAAIGLNERYLYANELFDGDMEVFTETINKLNDCENYDEAHSYCSKELKDAHGWDDDNELYSALLILLERRFQ